MVKITEVLLIHCDFVNNSYQQSSRVLYTIVHNKSFRQLLLRYFTQKFYIFKNF